MATINRFEDLEIWLLALILYKDINLTTRNIPFQNDYSLVDQIKRSSGSVMDIIAEGFERDGNKEFIYFLNIAKGSAGETRSQLFRAFDSGYIDQECFDTKYEECIKLSNKIKGFITYLKNSEYKGLKYK